MNYKYTRNQIKMHTYGSIGNDGGDISKSYLKVVMGTLLLFVVIGIGVSTRFFSWNIHQYLYFIFNYILNIRGWTK